MLQYINFLEFDKYHLILAEEKPERNQISLK